MKIFIKLVVTIVVLFTASIADAQTAPWQLRNDGKVVYYYTTNGDYSLVITCPQRGNGGDDYSTINLFNHTKKIEVKNFKIAVGTKKADWPVNSDSNADESIFLTLSKVLRTEPATVQIGNQILSFSKQGAANIIPDVKSDKFNCRTMWRE